jgi:hypothetical protein
MGYRCAVSVAKEAPALTHASLPTTAATATRRLRILFVVQRATLDRFVVLLPSLAARGHELHVAFGARRGFDPLRGATAPETAIPPRSVKLVEDLCREYPNVTYGLAPHRRDGDGWRQVAWIVRGLADLGLNASPRFAGAEALRKRTRKRVLKQLRRPGDFEPLARRIALRAGEHVGSSLDAGRSRRVLRLAARLEDAIPTSKEIDEYVRQLAPDVVLTSGTFRHVSEEVEFLKSARRLGIPSGIVVPSWDNLTNHGSLKFVPERIFVWNELQVRDAVELHGMPRERVRATGAHVFDPWFELRPSRERNEFLTEVGLDPAHPYVAYFCSSPNIVADDEVEFVRGWVDALRSSGDERLQRIGVLVRPHPNASASALWRDVEFGANSVVWPPQGAHPNATADSRADFFDTLAHSAAVVGINTTAMIEAAILGKSVLTVLVPRFTQKSSLHFRYLLAENGGFLHVGKTLEEHVEQLRGVLDEDAVGAERRRRFVAEFVRPGGVEQPTTPIAVRAIEELADVPVQRPKWRATQPLLRAVLSLEAVLSAVHGRRRSGRAAAA